MSWSDMRMQSCIEEGVLNSYNVRGPRGPLTASNLIAMLVRRRSSSMLRPSRPLPRRQCVALMVKGAVTDDESSSLGGGSCEMRGSAEQEPVWLTNS